MRACTHWQCGNISHVTSTEKSPLRGFFSKAVYCVFLVYHNNSACIQVAYRDDIWVKTLCVFLKCIRVCDNALLLLHVHVIVFICILI